MEVLARPGLRLFGCAFVVLAGACSASKDGHPPNGADPTSSDPVAGDPGGADPGGPADPGEPADPGPNPQACGATPFTLAGRSFEKLDVDLIGGAPIYPELALGPDGQPWVAFTKGTATARFPAVAHFDGTVWGAAEVVEQADNTYMGKRPSIVVDASDGLHLVYYNEDAMRVRYAHRPSGGTWTTAYLYNPAKDAGDHSSLAMDPSAHLRTSFLEYGDYRLIYGERGDTAWSFAPLKRDGIPVTVSVGTLAVDRLGRSHIVYVTDQGVHYAVGDASGFSHEDVELTSADTGHYPSLTLDSALEPHAVYLEWPSASSAVWVADRTTGGWTTHKVDDGLGVTYTTGIASFCDTLVIAYARNGGVGADGLYVAYRLPGETDFTIELVDGDVAASGIHLVAANDGTLHLVYLDETSLTLKHARLSP